MPTSGSLARVPAPAPKPAAAPKPDGPPIVVAQAAAAAAAGAPRQASLFQTGKVIPFEAFAPAPLAPKPAPVRARQTPRPPKAAAPNEAQSSLDFLPAAPLSPRTLESTVEARIYCDFPVATPPHRAAAAAVDCSFILIAYGLFLTAYIALGGGLAFDKISLAIVGGAGILIAAFYGFVWVWAGARTPGFRSTGLMLVNFDGHPPDRLSRWLRLLGLALSLCAGALGIVWMICDEEKLSWHDHISKTFPTVRESDSSFVRRR